MIAAGKVVKPSGVHSEFRNPHSSPTEILAFRVRLDTVLVLVSDHIPCVVQSCALPSLMIC